MGVRGWGLAGSAESQPAMPTLDESAPEIREALAGHYGDPTTVPATEGRFAAILAAVLARAIAPGKVRRVLEALRDAGLLEPEAMAEADGFEVAETLKQRGVSVSARSLGPLMRLARWVVER